MGNSKKKPEYIPFDQAQDRLSTVEGPITIPGPAGQTYTITITERGGLRIELDERHRIIYTSLITDSVRHLRFEVEPVQRSRLATKNLNEC